MQHADRGGATVSARQLSLRYASSAGIVDVLDELELEIPAGEFLCVLGPSGTGKTSLLHLMAGLLAPNGGCVRIDGTEISGLTADAAAVFRRRNIGIVFQFFNLLPLLDLVENVALPLLLDGVRLKALRPRIDALLERLGLFERSTHAVDELSGGELQRAALARALLIEPKLILADEPTGNLDSSNAANVLRLLRDLTRELGVTTVLFTHDLSAVSYADRVLTLREGRMSPEA
ncbi:MAG: ABC transporter ATP-binding protein [Myxococcota bacterium]